MSAKKSHHFISALLLVSCAGFTSSCNLTGGIDDPKSAEDIVSASQALIEQDKCQDAVEKLATMPVRGDRANQMLGWAHLCVAGATIDKVGKALFSYSSATNNLTVVGDLANALIPSNGDKETSVNRAIEAFTAMQTGDERQISIALGQMVKAAAIVAKASADNIVVRRSDVSPSNCLGTTCSTDPAACVEVRLNDNDTNKVATALDAAATAVGGTSTLGAIKDLAQRLGASDGTLAQGTRCAIYNSMLRE